MTELVKIDDGEEICVPSSLNDALSDGLRLAAVDKVPRRLKDELDDTLVSPLVLFDAKIDELTRLLIDDDGDDVEITLLNGEREPVRVNDEIDVPLDELLEQLDIVRDRGGERDNVSKADFFAEKEELLVTDTDAVETGEVRDDRERLGPPLDDRDMTAVRDIVDVTVVVTELRVVREALGVKDDLNVEDVLVLVLCETLGELEEENVPMLSDTERRGDSVVKGVAVLDMGPLDEGVREGRFEMVFAALTLDV